MEIKEQLRLEALRKYHILDTAEEKDFDEIVQLASAICDAPISLISLVDDQRQWFKAKVGLDVRHTDRNISFCQHALKLDDVMVVEDATLDIRFKNNPLVLGDPDIRFYAGMPLTTPEGFNIGTLCVIDRIPRNLGIDQKNALRILSRQVIKLLELRISIEKLNNYSRNADVQTNELVRLNIVKDKIFSIVAHDLRGPIGNISQILELIDQGLVDSAEQPALLSELNKATKETSALLENLLFWARTNTQGIKPERKAVHLNKVTEEVLSLLNKPAVNKQIRLINKIDDNLMASGDEEIVRLLLRNLISNAIKFCSAGDTITIGGSVSGEMVRLSVADTGSGISYENQEKIFKKDEHFTTFGSGNEKGTGLGLMLCKEFAEAQSGTISFTSEPGKGSEFFFTMPAL